MKCHDDSAWRICESEIYLHQAENQSLKHNMNKPDWTEWTTMISNSFFLGLYLDDLAQDQYTIRRKLGLLAAEDILVKVNLFLGTFTRCCVLYHVQH